MLLKVISVCIYLFSISDHTGGCKQVSMVSYKFCLSLKLFTDPLSTKVMILVLILVFLQIWRSKVWSQVAQPNSVLHINRIQMHGVPVYGCSFEYLQGLDSRYMRATQI